MTPNILAIVLAAMSVLGLLPVIVSSHRRLKYYKQQKWGRSSITASDERFYTSILLVYLLLSFGALRFMYLFTEAWHWVVAVTIVLFATALMTIRHEKIAKRKFHSMLD